MFCSVIRRKLKSWQSATYARFDISELSLHQCVLVLLEQICLQRLQDHITKFDFPLTVARLFGRLEVCSYPLVKLSLKALNFQTEWCKVLHSGNLPKCYLLASLFLKGLA